MRITSRLVVFLTFAILGLLACVDVPDGVRAQFAGPGANDRSNFRVGQHGQAPPVEEPPVAKASGSTTLTSSEANIVDTDASAASTTMLTSDGGSAP